MYVCICKSVTDSKINQAVDEGVSSFSQMQTTLGVATACGQCACDAKRILQAKLQKELAARSLAVPSVNDELFSNIK